MPIVYLDTNFMMWLAAAPDWRSTLDALRKLEVVYVRGDVVGRELATGDPERGVRVLDRLQPLPFVRLPDAGDWEALRAEGDERERLRSVFRTAHGAVGRAAALDVAPGAFAGSVDFGPLLEVLRAQVEALGDAEPSGIFRAILEVLESVGAGRIELSEARDQLAALVPTEDGTRILRQRVLNAFAMTDARAGNVVRGEASNDTEKKLGTLARDMERLEEFQTHSNLIDFIQLDGRVYRQLHANPAHPLYAVRGRTFTASDLESTVAKLAALIETVVHG